MGARVRYKLSDGRMLEVPDEDIDEFEAKLNGSGLKAEAMGASDYAGAEDGGDTLAPSIAPEARSDPKPDPVRAQDDHENPTVTQDEYEGLAPQAEQDHVMSMLQDPVHFAKQLVGAGGRFAGAALGASGAPGIVQGALNGAVGAGVGEASSALGREEMSIRGLVEAAKDTGKAMLTGGALGGFFGGISRGANAAGDAARSGADSARLSAGGVKGPQLQAYADQQGLDIGPARRQLASEGERLVAPEGGFRNAERMQQQYGQLANGLNGSIESQIDDAAMAGARMPSDVRSQVAQNLYQQSDAAKRSGFSASEADPRSAVARNVELGPQSYTPQDLRAQKMGFDANAYKGAPGTPESMQGIANKAAGDQYRGQLDSYMQQAGPEVYDPFKQASSDYGVAATWRDAAEAKAAQQATSFAGGQGSGIVDRALSMVPYGNRVADGAASALSGVSSQLNGIGDMSNYAARAAPAASETAVSALSNASRESRGEKPMSQSEDTNQPIFKDSRGDQLGVRMLQVVKSPEGRAAMNPWEDELMKAETPDEATAIVQRLMATDPQFAKTLSPFLQGRNR